MKSSTILTIGADPFQPMPYEGYNRRYGDIAIIELNRDIPRSEGLPACMPERKESLGTHLTAVGYGWDRK